MGVGNVRNHDHEHYSQAHASQAYSVALLILLQRYYIRVNVFKNRLDRCEEWGI